MSKEIEWELLRLTFLIKVCQGSPLLEFLKQGLKKKNPVTCFSKMFFPISKYKVLKIVSIACFCV